MESKRTIMILGKAKACPVPTQRNNAMRLAEPQIMMLSHAHVRGVNKDMHEAQGGRGISSRGTG